MTTDADWTDPDWLEQLLRESDAQIVRGLHADFIEAVAQELRRKLKANDFMLTPGTLPPQTVLVFVDAMLLALRHPMLGILESPHEVAKRFIADAREYFADCPHVLELIRRGER